MIYHYQQTADLLWRQNPVISLSCHSERIQKVFIRFVKSYFIFIRCRNVLYNKHPIVTTLLFRGP